MENRQHRDSLIERRHHNEQQAELWEHLTLAQKFSASSLTKYGYDLAFIRNSASGSLAVMVLDNHTTTIADDGDINTTPGINIR